MEGLEIDKKYLGVEPYSFGGKYRLYENFGLSNKAIVDKALKRSDIYSRFLQYKKPRRYSPIFVDNKRELFQCDLIAFTNDEFAKNNDGYLYLFTTIDVFSKYAWVYKLKTKECKAVMECFKDILSKCGKKPQRVQTDRGTEFVCKAFKKYFKEQGIHHYVSYSDRKCPVIERFNLTIQQLIFKVMDQKGTLRWIDCLKKAMAIYLGRTHSTIKMSPIKGELKKSESLVRKNLYTYFFKSGSLQWQKAKYKIGDTVRVWKYHRKFKRGYEDNFTKEYFTICKVLKNLPVVRYKLKDINGEEILGSYFQEELVPYTEPEFHKIIIIDTKGSGKSKKYLIKYDGWDDKYNRWVKAQDMMDINTSDAEDEIVESERFYDNYEDSRYSGKRNNAYSNTEMNPVDDTAEDSEYNPRDGEQTALENRENEHDISNFDIPIMENYPLMENLHTQSNESIPPKRTLQVKFIDDEDVQKMDSSKARKIPVSVFPDVSLIKDIPKRKESINNQKKYEKRTLQSNENFEKVFKSSRRHNLS